MDIDANLYYNEEPSMNKIRDDLQSAINNYNTNYLVSIYQDYGEKCSAGFRIIDKSNDFVLFSMDIDVNWPRIDVKKYQIDSIKFLGATPEQMISDKLFVLSTPKIFRRIKDLIDLYYFSKVYKFDKDVIIEILHKQNKQLDSFSSFLERIDDLHHSYEKFQLTGLNTKPNFDDVYNCVKNYVKDFIS